MSTQNKVVRITCNASFEHILDDIRDGLRDDTIENCVIVANQKLPDGSKMLHRYWWGKKTSTYILGLLEYMKAHITRHMLNKDELDWDED